MCRKLETEAEKVLPFYASSLAPEEDDDVAAAMQEAPSEPLAEVHTLLITWLAWTTVYQYWYQPNGQFVWAGAYNHSLKFSITNIKCPCTTVSLVVHVFTTLACSNIYSKRLTKFCFHYGKYQLEVNKIYWNFCGEFEKLTFQV